MIRGPFTIFPEAYIGEGEYAPSGDIETVGDWRSALAAARAAYDRTGVLPRVIGAGGTLIDLSKHAANWGSK